MTSHHFKCKIGTDGNMTLKQKWCHLTGDVLVNDKVSYEIDDEH